MVSARGTPGGREHVTITLWIMGVLLGAGAALVVVALAAYFHERNASGQEAQPVPDGRFGSVAKDSEELAQLLAARMDEKGAELEELLAEADRRIVRLRTLLRESEVEVKQRARPSPALQPAHTEERAELLKAVYQMADAGRTVVEIARSTNQPTGNVELILALRKV
jgi:hypothetical protein